MLQHYQYLVFMAEEYSIICLSIIHRWTSELFIPFGCCEQTVVLWTITGFACTPVFSSFRHICRSGVIGSYVNFLFNFLRNSNLFSTKIKPFLHYHHQHEGSSLSIYSPMVGRFYVKEHPGCQVRLDCRWQWQKLPWWMMMTWTRVVMERSRQMGEVFLKQKQ